MKTYFVCSDIHGFYKEWMIALKEAGYNKSDKEHILVVLGDIFDRGKEPWKVYKFLKSLPEDRLLLVKGNHEYLLLELVKRRFAFDYDYFNGTYNTLVSLHKDPLKEAEKWRKKNGAMYDDENKSYFDSLKIFRKTQAKLYTNKRIKEIINWLNSPQWLNYCEIHQYICVHSFIPLKDGGYFPNWRKESTPKMWEEATWGCPFRLFQVGNFKEEIKKGKILVCGHWHTSDFYNNLIYYKEPKKQLDVRANNPIFMSDKYPNLIGLDACTALTKKVNIFVISEYEELKKQILNCFSDLSFPISSCKKCNNSKKQ